MHHYAQLFLNFIISYVCAFGRDSVDRCHRGCPEVKGLFVRVESLPLPHGFWRSDSGHQARQPELSPWPMGFTLQRAGNNCICFWCLVSVMVFTTFSKGWTWQRRGRLIRLSWDAGEIKGESDGNGRAGPGLLISSIHFRSPKTHVCAFCGTENTCLPLSVPNLEKMHSGIGMWLNLPIKASYSAL